MQRKVVIVSAVRTPIGAFGGIFKNVSAVELGKSAVQGALEKINLDPQQVDEVIIGNVLQAGLGQNVARQVAIGAGLPIHVPSFTINHVCGSGLQAVKLAVQSILLGDANVVVAGGTENMSLSPHILNNHRFGEKMGDIKVIDSMITDGLWDAFHDYHMGITAENVAQKYNISRQEQDELAASSQNKAENAINNNKFKDEIIPVTVKQPKNTEVIIDKDEYPRFGTTVEKLAKLKPAFKTDGSVTAGNSSGINDGAAILILMSEEKAKELNLAILGTIKSYAFAGVEPETMGIGPIPSSQAALQKANLTIDDIDLVEANEAFAAQASAVQKELNINPQKLNVNGGAIALGHPIGASGARILVTLIHEMKKQASKYGLATLCIGGGQGGAIIIEREAN